MKKTVTPDQLGAEIAAGFEQYSSELTEQFKIEAKDCAERLTQDIKNACNIFKGKGKYAKGWTFKKTFENKDQIAYTTHNKTDYQLTHLLEYGHAKWVWGKNTGDRVKAFPHIRPNAEKWMNEFANRCKDVIAKSK